MTASVLKNKTVSISKEELAGLPTVHYTDGAIVIDSDSGLEEAVAHLAQADIIGFDTETRPSFRKGQSHSVSLLQLASPERCYLFRLKTLGVQPALKGILENPDLLKVGLSLRDDFHALSRICNFTPAGFLDLQQYVKKFGIADNSLSRIYGILFGQRISKGQRLSNWEAEKLTPAQINYAAFDAISCIQIYKHLSSKQFNPLTSKYLKDLDQP